MKRLRVGFAVGTVMLKRGFFLVMLMMLAQPAAATQMVNLANSERVAAPADCPAEDPACTTDGIAGAQAASAMESGDTGPIIAGLLGLVVGRRKNGLPEVVS
jgi:hypothetical protein